MELSFAEWFKRSWKKRPYEYFLSQGVRNDKHGYVVKLYSPFSKHDVLLEAQGYKVFHIRCGILRDLLQVEEEVLKIRQLGSIAAQLRFAEVENEQLKLKEVKDFIELTSKPKEFKPALLIRTKNKTKRI